MCHCILRRRKNKDARRKIGRGAAGYFKIINERKSQIQEEHLFVRTTEGVLIHKQIYLNTLKPYYEKYQR